MTSQEEKEPYAHTYYQRHLFKRTDRKYAMDNLEVAIRLITRKYTDIIFVMTGVSGFIPLHCCLLYNQKFCYVRKEHTPHTDIVVESVDHITNWFFLDDQIETGTTLKRVKHEISKVYPNSIYRGSYLYLNSEFINVDGTTVSNVP